MIKQWNNILLSHKGDCYIREAVSSIPLEARQEIYKKKFISHHIHITYLLSIYINIQKKTNLLVKLIKINLPRSNISL